MNVTHERKGTVTVFEVKGSLDALTAPHLTDYLSKQLSAGNHRVVLNLADLEYTSSAGLRVILNTVKEVRQHSGDLRIAGVHGGVRKVFEMSGFTNIIKFFPDADAAVKSFAN